MKKNRCLDIGSVSEGTLRLEDLIPCLLGALEPLHLSKYERRIVRTTRHDLEHFNEEEREAYFESDALYDYDDLMSIAQNHSPALCYFGCAEGDGSSIGCWPDWDAVDEAVRCGELTMTKDEGVPSARLWKTDLFMQVSDHGNVILYRRDSRNRMVQVWSGV